jgi:hypothetical protein
MAEYSFTDRWQDELKVSSDGRSVILDVPGCELLEFSPEVAKQVAYTIYLLAKEIEGHGPEA